jgi:peptidyl-prolyl cis-trans isomerase B (cyclophilin B)
VPVERFVPHQSRRRPKKLGVLAGCCAVQIAATALGDSGQTDPAPAAPALRIDGLYHGPLRPIPVAIDGLAEGASVDLVLLDGGGAERGRVAVAAGGAVELWRDLPVLRDATSAMWLQLERDGVSIGTPWVAQPLIARPQIRVRTAVRPDGTTEYTRIVGWGDRLLDPDDAVAAEAKLSWKAGDPTPFSGLRIYEDRDVLLETDAGPIRIALAPDRAPNTAWNFRTLAEGRFYDGTTFHRVVKFDREGRPFVIQGGDPTGGGDGGPGYDLPMEPSDLPHEFGVISMARNDGPDTAGSQFFIALSREGTARLDGQYCAFGWAVDGADAIVAIADAEIADLASGRPRTPPVVRSASLVPAPPRSVGVGRPDRRVAPPSAEPRPVPREPDR